MKFSVIMPSFLGYYAGAARDRHNKIHRAVQSVISQTYSDWQLIVVSDACQDTIDQLAGYSDPRIHVFHILKKERTWSGRVRNLGIFNAQGEYIIYLDIDDYYGPDHLLRISEQLKDCDWVYFDDLTHNKGDWNYRACDLTKWGSNGTSNVCHKRSLNAYWDKHNYAHDWHFINTLKKSSTNFCQLQGAQYHVCHLPAEYDI